MPKTFSGRLAGIILAIFVIQVVVFIINLFSNNGFGAIVNFIRIAPFTSLLGLIFGVTGSIKETGNSRALPVITTSLSVVLGGFTWFFLFGWSFGG
ncbi:hypothetical protein [Guptibacillus hwajinpoensis]|uniref:Uncharacterized protein n=1 Tax=Guptibacillus hwajinpoensis TaxID=208199 RepID=A0A0J6D4A8_9BACL|nr:hypothetical protein [Alkalihalobacillus macyae]KMM39134.1 hypothetical protein AB986_07855 [Alkalihalobacillus macyae]